MKNIFLIFLLSQLSVSIAQKSNDIDFFNYEYEYLDKDFNINISSEKFDSLAVKYEFYKNRISKYQDSLAVILVENFDGNWKKTNKAKFRIGYTWDRLSYHLWMNIEKSKEFAKQFNIYHPYLFKQFLINNKNNEKINFFFKELKEKITNNLENPIDLNELNRNQLLNFAMRHSKSRITDFQTKSYSEEHGKNPDAKTKLGVSCGKENCCQLKKSE